MSVSSIRFIVVDVPIDNKAAMVTFLISGDLVSA